MANLKSAIKRVRVNEERRERNKAIKSRMRNQIKAVEALIEANDAENAKTAYQTAARTIDKAVQKGVIHKNNGNRNKARLAKKLRKVTA